VRFKPGIDGAERGARGEEVEFGAGFFESPAARGGVEADGEALGASHAVEVGVPVVDALGVAGGAVVHGFGFSGEAG
jgi:hypothetical protein